jgi:hypothetical protein
LSIRNPKLLGYQPNSQMDFIRRTLPLSICGATDGQEFTSEIEFHLWFSSRILLTNTPNALTSAASYRRSTYANAIYPFLSSALINGGVGAY